MSDCRPTSLWPVIRCLSNPIEQQFSKCWTQNAFCSELERQFLEQRQARCLTRRHSAPQISINNLRDGNVQHAVHCPPLDPCDLQKAEKGTQFGVPDPYGCSRAKRSTQCQIPEPSGYPNTRQCRVINRCGHAMPARSMQCQVPDRHVHPQEARSPTQCKVPSSCSNTVATCATQYEVPTHRRNPLTTFGKQHKVPHRSRNSMTSCATQCEDPNPSRNSMTNCATQCEDPNPSRNSMTNCATQCEDPHRCRNTMTSCAMQCKDPNHSRNSMTTCATQCEFPDFSRNSMVSCATQCKGHTRHDYSMNTCAAQCQDPDLSDHPMTTSVIQHDIPKPNHYPTAECSRSGGLVTKSCLTFTVYERKIGEIANKKLSPPTFTENKIWLTGQPSVDSSSSSSTVVTENWQNESIRSPVPNIPLSETGSEFLHRTHRENNLFGDYCRNVDDKSSQPCVLELEVVVSRRPSSKTQVVPRPTDIQFEVHEMELQGCSSATVSIKIDLNEEAPVESVIGLATTQSQLMVQKKIGNTQHTPMLQQPQIAASQSLPSIGHSHFFEVQPMPERQRKKKKKEKSSRSRHGRRADKPSSRSIRQNSSSHQKKFQQSQVELTQQYHAHVQDLCRQETIQQLQQQFQTKLLRGQSQSDRIPGIALTKLLLNEIDKMECNFDTVASHIKNLSPCPVFQCKTISEKLCNGTLDRDKNRIHQYLSIFPDTASKYERYCRHLKEQQTCNKCPLPSRSCPGCRHLKETQTCNKFPCQTCNNCRCLKQKKTCSECPCQHCQDCNKFYGHWSGFGFPCDSGYKPSTASQPPCSAATKDQEPLAQRRQRMVKLPSETQLKRNKSRNKTVSSRLSLSAKGKRIKSKTKTVSSRISLQAKVRKNKSKTKTVSSRTSLQAKSKRNKQSPKMVSSRKSLQVNQMVSSRLSLQHSASTNSKRSNYSSVASSASQSGSTRTVPSACYLKPPDHMCYDTCAHSMPIQPINSWQPKKHSRKSKKCREVTPVQQFPTCHPSASPITPMMSSPFETELQNGITGKRLCSRKPRRRTGLNFCHYRNSSVPPHDVIYDPMNCMHPCYGTRPDYVPCDPHKYAFKWGGFNTCPNTFGEFPPSVLISPKKPSKQLKKRICEDVAKQMKDIQLIEHAKLLQRTVKECDAELKKKCPLKCFQ